MRSKRCAVQNQGITLTDYNATVYSVISFATLITIHFCISMYLILIFPRVGTPHGPMCPVRALPLL